MRLILYVLAWPYITLLDWAKRQGYVGRNLTAKERGVQAHPVGKCTCVDCIHAL